MSANGSVGGSPRRVGSVRPSPTGPTRFGVGLSCRPPRTSRSVVGGLDNWERESTVSLQRGTRLLRGRACTPSGKQLLELPGRLPGVEQTIEPLDEWARVGVPVYFHSSLASLHRVQAASRRTQGRHGHVSR